MDNSLFNPAASISLRRVVLPDDEAFLARLYFSTREDLAALPLDDFQKEILLHIQYAAQKQDYERRFPNAADDIILFDKQMVGRVLTTRDSDKLLVIDIVILPEHRKLGIATDLMRNLLREAAENNQVFTLRVLKTNLSATRLYRRLGLSVTDETETHYQMERHPPVG